MLPPSSIATRMPLPAASVAAPKVAKKPMIVLAFRRAEQQDAGYEEQQSDENDPAAPRENADGARRESRLVSDPRLFHAAGRTAPRVAGDGRRGQATGNDPGRCFRHGL